MTSTAARERSSSNAAFVPPVAGTPVGGPVPQDAVAASEPQDGSPSLEDMRNELSDIRAQRSPEVKGGLFVSSNNAAPGIGQLTSIQQPLEGVLPVGNGKLSIRMTPVELEGGTLGTDVYSASQFGGGPAAARSQFAGKVAAPDKQSAYGVGLGLGYEVGNWMADIGTTPLGFKYTNVVGGVTFRNSINAGHGSWFNVGASRRAVTDSITSFAGSTDSRSGLSWGGVTATGVHGAIGLDNQDYGVYGYGSVKYLDGHNVQSNVGAEIGGGTYWYLLRTQNSMLSAGLNLSGMIYDHNENNFTYGNGGYFSPQRFYAFNLPLTWAQRSDRWTYKLQGAIGVQYYHQAGTPYFPNDSGLQAAAVSAASAIDLADGAVHPDQSSTGFGYNLLAAAEYRFTNHLVGGASVGANNSSSYRQWAAGLYLRYTLAPQSKSLDMPVIPYQSHYSDQ
jgi:hypothetical protein